MRAGRKGVALGYGAPAKQSTGVNEVSEADERIAKCGTADPNEGSASEQSEGNAQKLYIIERKWRNHDKRRIF